MDYFCAFLFIGCLIYFNSVNPDNNYRVVSFDHDARRLDGRILEPVCRDPNDKRSVRIELLRWHFRQVVLANMKGAGEPNFETDFLPETDMVAEILGGPEAAKGWKPNCFQGWRSGP
ncbi:hypothetical protein V1520DRAFT_380829 [Lipomyces starkeyi]|uniref:Uncharacterized protein n=1 Tax=Lipomyces starkeyi NRRL Y-11557 TaxID=675824 RepID=A0A1E3PW05_LIPST|nr:hypothetical protein LIPSTDRAFT_334273 [Lipomyces starkeyi NRRL Y-11557]